MEKLAPYIDHTLLKPEASRVDIERLCLEAVEHSFHAVCVHGSRVALAHHCLENSNVQIACVIGFPLGAMDADVKRYETEAAIDSGAHEIDMVLNIGRFKEGDDAYVLREIRDVVEAADGHLVKVILETGYLDQEEIVRACRLVLDAEAHFVKTCTGFGPGQANVQTVHLMRETVGRNCGVKASAGIRDRETALALLRAGASRLGTSSGPALVAGESDASADY